MQKYNVIKNLLIASFVVGQKRKSGLFKLKIQKRIKLLADCLLQEPYSILQLLNRILLLHPIVFCFFLFFSFFCFFVFFFLILSMKLKLMKLKILRILSLLLLHFTQVSEFTDVHVETFETSENAVAKHQVTFLNNFV